jgi:hypothetical protein
MTKMNRRVIWPYHEEPQTWDLSYTPNYNNRSSCSRIAPLALGTCRNHFELLEYPFGQLQCGRQKHTMLHETKATKLDSN